MTANVTRLKKTNHFSVALHQNRPQHHRLQLKPSLRPPQSSRVRNLFFCQILLKSLQLFYFVFLTAGASCKNPQNKNGVCIKFRECPKLFQIFQSTPISPKNRELLRRSQCAFKDNVAYVCCVQEDEVTTQAPIETTTLKGTDPDWLKTLKQKVPQAPECGNDAENRIFGGNVTEINEFGWTVLLEYKKSELVQYISGSFKRSYSNRV